MRISQETIDALAEKGITVKWYPERTREQFEAKIWQAQYNFSYNYQKDHVAGCELVKAGRTNVLFDSVEALEKNCRDFADRTYKRHCDPYEFSTLYIEYDGRTVVRKISGKGQAVTSEYVLKAVERDKKSYSGAYGKFALAMQEICRAKGYADKFCVYPTTYGIGIWSFYNFQFEKNVADVREIMDSKGIEYYNEFSDARWVYRFKVSKKSENLARLSA